ncbi:P-loop containing nucleoside triphosphate hydrolase protein [Collybia nuda]|uniref:P-loop containing nucleoside triphosphate hydrolase protein n=1 Tax=Collybia nuda TaxID=64659 RepID=A0A9P5XRI2_9AGAR|nr:P-loop containing nucleoside triphosphate hydrolase protein [Collybia nuda]
MPSHTVHSALIQMHLDDGAPWVYPRWMEITGVTHGIFPDEDSPLPKGLTRQDLVYLRSYFDQYGKKVKEDDKIKFASATKNSAQVPGRRIWRQWVTDRWRDWKIHMRIISILKAENLHPISLALSAQEPDAVEMTIDTFWPPGKMYIPMAVDSVALELFGMEIQNSRGAIPPRARGIVQALIQRTWKVIHNQVDRSQGRIRKVEEEAIRAFEALNQESPTKAKIKSVITKVHRWRDLTEFLQSKHNVETMASMIQALEELMSGLGASIEPSKVKPKTKLCKVSPRKLKLLADQEDVTDVLAMYHDFFSCPSAQDSVDLTEQHPTVPFQFGKLEDDTDPGVEMESTLSPDILASNLGFKDGLPLLFSRYRHRGGLTSWDAGKSHLFEDVNAREDSQMDQIKLHWHQLAGVHGLVRMVFGPTPDAGRGCGALVADEVGLGKTYQAVTMIAFLTDIVLRQKVLNASASRGTNNQQIVSEENPYAGDRASLLEHDHPHLIAVPGTLLSQWEVEIKSIVKGGTFTILLYGSGKAYHDFFWGPDGPYQKAKHSGVNILIIAAHSALQQDFSLLYAWKKPRTGDLPWKDPDPVKNYSDLVSNTLYGRRFLSVTLDEAQGFRNAGAKHSSVLLLRRQSLFFFALTATPLQTSTKDIAAIGRIIGIPHFLTAQAFEQEKNDISFLRQAKKAVEDVTDGEDMSELTLRQMTIAQRMQTEFEGRVLRRTTDSKDWKGKVLIPLPPSKELRLVVKLTDREMDIISKLADDVSENMSAANSFLMVPSQSFYIGHRMAVNYARETPEEKIPHFKTLEEWEAKKSTKIDTCVKLCQHLLSHDDAPEVFVANGSVVYPPLPNGTDPSKATRKRKVVIYQEFPSHGPLLRNILDLYGIKHLYLDGQTQFGKRAKIVKEFNESGEYRVLIVSSVGATGLNLSVASVMILLDQLWSAQDERQVFGRIRRQPQSAEVLLIHILGDETADIILAAMASGKKSMMTAFVLKIRGRGARTGDPVLRHC